MKIIACIPARYGSTRFCGKVLAKDTGKFLIQHTWERACLAKLPDRVIIAADDQRVVDAATSFGADCVLTSPDCQSGTDRIAEAIEKYIEEQSWQVKAIKDGIKEADKGNFAEDKEIEEFLSKWGLNED